VQSGCGCWLSRIKKYRSRDVGERYNCDPERRFELSDLSTTKGCRPTANATGNWHGGDHWRRGRTFRGRACPARLEVITISLPVKFAPKLDALKYGKCPIWAKACNFS
jgi:hypothetical protein